MLVVGLAFITPPQGLPPNIVGLPVILVDDRWPAHKQPILYMVRHFKVPVGVK